MNPPQVYMCNLLFPSWFSLTMGLSTHRERKKEKKKEFPYRPRFYSGLSILSLLIHFLFLCFSSVQFSHSVVSDSLQPHGL